MKTKTKDIPPVDSGNKAASRRAPTGSKIGTGIMPFRFSLMFPVILLLTWISFSGCQGANQSRQMIERSEQARAAQKLIDTATALCKLDVLENEGGATLSAYAPGATTMKKQKEINNLSASYADLYMKTLKQIRKYPRQEMEDELQNLRDSPRNQPGSRVIFPVIMRHVNKVYLGMPIAAKDVSQDFQALRYRHSLPKADQGEQ